MAREVSLSVWAEDPYTSIAPPQVRAALVAAH